MRSNGLFGLIPCSIVSLGFLTLTSCDFSPLEGDELAVKLGEVPGKDSSPASTTNSTLADTNGELQVDSKMGAKVTDNEYVFANDTGTMKALLTFKDEPGETSGTNKVISALTLTIDGKTYTVPPAALVAPSTKPSKHNTLYINTPQMIYVQFTVIGSDVVKLSLFCGVGDDSCDVVYTWIKGTLSQREIMRNGVTDTATYAP